MGVTENVYSFGSGFLGSTERTPEGRLLLTSVPTLTRTECGRWYKLWGNLLFAAESEAPRRVPEAPRPTDSSSGETCCGCRRPHRSRVRRRGP